MNAATHRKHGPGGSDLRPQRTRAAHASGFQCWIEQRQACQGQAHAGDTDYGCVEWFIYHEDPQDESADT